MRPEYRAKAVLRWLVAGLLYLLIAALQLAGIGTLAACAVYLGYLAWKGTVFDAVAALSILGVLIPLIAFVGAAWAIWRRRPPLALAYSVLVLPIVFFFEANSCDAGAFCRLLSWAAVPVKNAEWSIRIRPVTDPNEAEEIAWSALSKARSKDSVYKARRFTDHWIVSTIDGDGWPGARAVRIDSRTGRTSFIPCPAERIQCGMERPIVSDGRSVFRDGKAGIAAIFPASRPVCASRGDDDQPRGFVAMVRAADIPCEILDQSRQMGVEIARNPRDECAIKQAPSTHWQPLSPETAKLFRSSPTLDGQPSRACELRISGQIQISLYAATSRSSAGTATGPLYEAYIVTTPHHLAEDISSFEVFLRSVKIGPA